MLDEVKEKSNGNGNRPNGVKVDLELQYHDRETDMRSIIDRVTEDYGKRGNDPDKIRALHIYLKPLDLTAYYVINETYEGKVPLF